MNLEESIEYLKNYKYDNEVRQAIETLLTVYEKEKEKREIAEADLYEANSRINDLLDIVKQKDKVINLMAEDLNDFYDDNALEYRKRTIEDTIKKFEERCK